jgi:copper chaperone CopZ
MTCGVCPLVVKQSLLRVEGVVGVEPDLARREATVTIDTEEASAADLQEAVRAAGYQSTVVHTYVPRSLDD